MNENVEKLNVDKLDGKGALWTIAGTSIAAVAGQLLGAHGGLGGCGTTGAAAALAAKDAEIAQLKANAATDAKLVEVYAQLRRSDKEAEAAIAALGTRVAAIETAAPLREQIVLGQVQSVANAATTGIANLQTQIACIQQTLAGITKCVVPITAVCPEPMPAKNSWTAPTAAAAT